MTHDDHVDIEKSMSTFEKNRYLQTEYNWHWFIIRSMHARVLCKPVPACWFTHFMFAVTYIICFRFCPTPNGNICDSDNSMMACWFNHTSFKPYEQTDIWAYPYEILFYMDRGSDYCIGFYKQLLHIMNLTIWLYMFAKSVKQRGDEMLSANDTCANFW